MFFCFVFFPFKCLRNLPYRLLQRGHTYGVLVSFLIVEACSLSGTCGTLVSFLEEEGFLLSWTESRFATFCRGLDGGRLGRYRCCNYYRLSCYFLILFFFYLYLIFLTVYSQKMMIGSQIHHCQPNVQLWIHELQIHHSHGNHLV